MEFTDYYATLGVPRDADQAAIKAAYRKLARALHPDVNRDSGAEARFKRVNEAYEVLKDPAKRAKYDRLGANWEEIERQQEAMRQARAAAGARSTARGAPSGFSDFFETFFGGGGLDLDDLFAGSGGTRTFQFGAGPGTSAQPRRGRDIEEDVDIALEEAVRGGVRLLSIGDRQVEVRVPAGVTDGSVVRVAGEGGPGAGGGGRGDVRLRVRVRPHPRFTVHRRDLRADLPVRDDVAVLGGEAEIAGVAGGPIRVTIPAGTRSGRILRLRGKGLPGLRGSTPGDLLLRVSVTVPDAISEEERDLYRRLASLRTPAPAPAPPPGG